MTAPAPAAPSAPAATWADPRLAVVLAQGFSSGLPLALTGATLSFWLSTVGVDKTTVGLFSLVASSYSLKYLWSWVVDQVRLPVLGRLGRRRSWALLLQLGLVAALFALGQTHPGVDPTRTAALAVAVAFLSATQDIVIDAWRIELLRPEQQGLGAAATQWGYRFGMIASGAGALYLSDAFGWAVSYTVMAALMAVGLVATALAPDTAAWPTANHPLAFAREAVVAPFQDFLRRDRWWAVLTAVVLYKFGDALAGTMTSPLYVELGFTGTEVASITKVLGVFASMAGIALGGALVARWGAARALLWCGGAQMLSNLGYCVLAGAGHDLTTLTWVIGLENLTGGMGSAAFVTWLSALCARNYTATQYALLSSLAAVGRTTLAASGGYLAAQLGWVPFFLLSTGAALPGIALVWWLSDNIHRTASSGEAAPVTPT
jgi:PAT family beta-lactamase induction signal transducer AmpG